MAKELARQLEEQGGIKVVDPSQLDVGKMSDLALQLKVIRASDGRPERLVPGSAVDMKKFKTRFAQKVKLNDIDHILMPRTVNGREPLVSDVRISYVIDSPMKFSDHFGKRAALEIDWEAVFPRGGGAQMGKKAEEEEDHAAATTVHEGGADMDVREKGKSKEREEERKKEDRGDAEAVAGAIEGEGGVG